ncbi:ribosome silencing factor [Pleionea mediterranea]|uniref:Ribosomal silencing factor RsfS n=1 Tax=Pleionea mediterranea TaxID=523701 RepID=A0A316FTE7_9GAMM|nr:ribosome silencing factor [Pleionea mediterranea]PWK51984.1 ribosome-associated protein [Pleionea mediterranea]
MDSKELIAFIVEQLEDAKAQHINVIDVKQKTSITDAMIVCSGTSSRHVKSIATQLVQKAKELGRQPLGVEGENGSEWVLVDFADAIVHVMQANIRDYYQIEKLWSTDTSS